MGKDQVGPQDQIASAEGQDIQALTKSSGLGEDQVGSQDQIASAEGQPFQQKGLSYIHPFSSHFI